MEASQDFASLLMAEWRGAGKEKNDEKLQFYDDGHAPDLRRIRRAVFISAIDLTPAKLFQVFASFKKMNAMQWTLVKLM
jgi:hypothetical protein